MDLIKEIKKAYLARKDTAKSNKMITLTDEARRKWRRIEKHIRESLPNLSNGRGMLSLFIEAIILGCEVELKKLETL